MDNHTLQIINWTNNIDFYYSAIFVPIGIMLNILTIIIFANDKPKPNAAHINLLYIGLAFYDSLACINSILFSQLLPSMGIFIVNYSNEACLILNYYRKVVVQASSWVQVVITFERYGSVVCAHQFNIFKNRSKTILILVSVFFILCFVNICQSWFHTEPIYRNVTTANNSWNYTIVALSCTASETVVLVTDIFNVMFRLLIPFVIMLIMNVLLSRALVKSKKRTWSTASVNSTRSLRRERTYTVTIVGFNCLFCILNIPWASWFVLWHIHKSGLYFQSMYDAAILDFFNAIAYSIFYVNDYSSFILNMCFNKRFRSRLVTLIMCNSRISRFNSVNGPMTKSVEMRRQNGVNNGEQDQKLESNHFLVC